MARSGSPAKTKSTAVIVDEPKKAIDAVSTTTTTTTTTTVTVVDETVVATSSEEESKDLEKEREEGKRELPIFNNPLLADDKSSAVALKPKSGRVKVQGGKTATIAVLKMSAPKVDGEVVVMRRMDSNLVNATLMFQAAFPAATEQWITRENSYLAKTYKSHGAVVEDSEGGAFAGVWVTVTQAKELAKEYSIEQFMLPLLNAPARKNTIKAAASSSPSPSTEVVTKEEQQTIEENVAAAVVVVEKVEVAISSSEEIVVVEEKAEVVTEEKTIEALEVKEVVETEEKVEVEAKEETNAQEQEQEQERSTGSKRGREEDEEQAAKDRKRFRGFVTVAVGLAAVAVTIPQVLPYFS